MERMPAASLEAFLQDEAWGALPSNPSQQVGCEEDDEYGDIDWCDAGDVSEIAQQPAIPQTEESAAPLFSEANPASDGPSFVAEITAQAKLSQDQRRLQAQLRRSAAERHRVLALCFVARLQSLSKVCDDMLVQAMVLSRMPKALDARALLDNQDRFSEMLPIGLVLASAEIRKEPDQPPAPPLHQVPVWAPRRFDLLQVLCGRRAASNEDLVLLLVARCRAEGIHARVAMAVPLPPAQSCGKLLSGASLPNASVWVELFDQATCRWGAVGHGRSDLPVGEDGSHSWVLAASEGCGLRDVTRRYCARWSSTLVTRGSLGRAWDALVQRFSSSFQLEAPDVPSTSSVNRACKLQRADQLDEEALIRRAQREPLPKSRTGFKRHSGYVLESQFRQNEIVHPPGAKPVGLFRGQEPVWKRADVTELRTPTQWRREGRCVRDGERASKTLRGGTAMMTLLYGIWQTDVLPESDRTVPEPRDQRGPIPGTNNYGNFEILDASSSAKLPPGTVYLPDEAVRSAAARLGISFAPAVVGFARERGLLRPRFRGAVIWERDQSAALEAATAERARLQALQVEQRAERLGAAWRLLIKNVLVDLYVEGRYGGNT